MLDLPTDLCSLPIIFDNGFSNTTHASTDASTSAEAEGGEVSHPITTTSSSGTSTAGQVNDSPALADVILDAAEDLWQHFTTSLSSSVTSKIREVCVEVLRRTDEDTSQYAQEGFAYDDDARFLD